ncbi:MAG: hypothetical protein O9340_03900 [Cyclobacteriaceae bacterium]|jgi:hypothetical protein|nr:hypothetical protein [Cyclobacteriaceae bacterium]
MNNSTDNVTLAAAFVNDILELYKENETDYPKLKAMAAGLDLSSPTNMVSMKVYNDMCDWIESQIGQANTRKLGRKIGNTAFNAMVAFKLIPEKPSPEEAMSGLAKVASTMIQDPLKRGWEIIENSKKYIIMRRTQTFNSTLQFGLLDEIIRKTGVISPKVEYVKSVANGDEFDEYKISWL